MQTSAVVPTLARSKTEEKLDLWLDCVADEKMAISRCLTRRSNLTCTTCLEEEMYRNVVATDDGAPVTLLSKSVGENGTQLTISILTPHRKQAMIPRGLGFCAILEVVFLYQPTVKTILSVRCYE